MCDLIRPTITLEGLQLEKLRHRKVRWYAVLDHTRGGPTPVLAHFHVVTER